MMHTPKRVVMVFGFLVAVCLLAGPVQAQFLDYTVTLDAYLYLRQGRVSSYARAVLYNNNGSRLYEQVILGHRVWNWYTGWLRYDGRAVNDLGYANSATGQLVEIPGECFIAEMAAHQNTYGLHVSSGTEPKCIPEPPDPPPPPPKENCPVLLDLGLNGFTLSGPEPAVDFDLDADGAGNSTSWTRRGGDEAFLALDRNGNGVIDDGTELFGFATPLADGRKARNGYRALAELDSAVLGGNGDKKIDSEDALFSELLVWVDRNRDGHSQQGEIRTAAETGIVELGYRSQNTNLWDEYGNLFDYRSYVLMKAKSGRKVVWPTYDVVFAEATP
jgi:hypothetical protein